MKNIVVFSLCMLMLALIGCKESEVGPESSDADTFMDNRINRLFIKHGLQRHCWVGTESEFIVDVNDWNLAGFGGPTFFRTPLWNPLFMEAKPSTQWSIAKGPYADQISGGPTEEEYNNGFLSGEHLKRIDDLTTICFGDEEAFSLELVSDLKSWYDVSRKHYPEVMVHNNQWGSQWHERDLRLYVAIAKPDLITFDAYLYDDNNSVNYRGSQQMAEYLMKYRNVALAGKDGVGEQPIGFGQYIQGYRKNGYDMTESQLRLYYFMTWTFGGKWLNWFRYLQESDLCVLLENGVAGAHTKAMQWTHQCNTESENLSDYLVRLQTTAVGLLLGEWGPSGLNPNNVPFWTAEMDSHIISISGELLGGEFTGSAGDVYIGYFDIIPAENGGDPGFFNNPDAQFFMVLNAFTTRNAETADDARQKITVELDIGARSTDCVKRVNREAGFVESIELTPMENGNYTFEIIIPGGTADLLFIE